jgi:hypothetical protein
MLYNFKNNFKHASVLKSECRAKNYLCMYNVCMYERLWQRVRELGVELEPTPANEKKQGLFPIPFFLPQSPAEPLAGRGAERKAKERPLPVLPLADDLHHCPREQRFVQQFAGWWPGCPEPGHWGSPPGRRAAGPPPALPESVPSWPPDGHSGA